MSVKFSARIKKVEAAIASELDPKKRAPLQSRLAVLMAAKAEMDDDDDDDDGKKGDDDDDGDDEESKAAKAAKAAEKAKAKAEASKHKAKAAEHRQKAAEYDEAAKKCEEASSEDDDDEARLRTPTPLALNDASTEILASQASMATEALNRVQALEAKALERDRQSVIAKLTAERRITPAEAKKWAKRDATFWAQVEEMRPHALVNVTEEVLAQPDGSPGGDIPANIKKIVEQSITTMNMGGEQAEKFREQSYADHRASMAKNAGVTH